MLRTWPQRVRASGTGPNKFGLRHSLTKLSERTKTTRPSFFLHRIEVRPFIALVAGLLLTAAHVTTARAASFDATDFVDGVDANMSDGNCATSSGTCTLRAAIQEANALTASGADKGPHTITLHPGRYDLTIAGRGEDDAATGDLDIKAEVIINGSGVGVMCGAAGSTCIDIVNGIDQVIHNFFNPTLPNKPGVTLHKLMITGGIITGTNEEGGGIKNVGKLMLKSVHVIGNESGGGVVGGIGMQPYNSTGGIFNDKGTVEIVESQVSRNSSNLAYGGIHNNSGTLSIISSTIGWNGTLGDGGGIANTGGISNAKVTINNSIVTGNTARRGGGILDQGATTMTNCTISENEAAKGDGGAIYANGVTTVTNNTMTNNTFRVTSGATPSAIYLLNATVVLQNTIVDEGTAGCGKSSSSSSLISQGYNIDRGTSCGLTSANNDRSGVDPLLGPLANNGGLTLTHALLPGSQAIDAAPVLGAPTMDQRGTARPQFACFSYPCHWIGQSILADIGAYELIQPYRRIRIQTK